MESQWNLLPDPKNQLFSWASVFRLKFVRASKFWKLPVQLADNDFGQSFTPGSYEKGLLHLVVRAFAADFYGIEIIVVTGVMVVWHPHYQL